MPKRAVAVWFGPGLGVVDLADQAVADLVERFRQLCFAGRGNQVQAGRAADPAFQRDPLTGTVAVLEADLQIDLRLVEGPQSRTERGQPPDDPVAFGLDESGAHVQPLADQVRLLRDSGHLACLSKVLRNPSVRRPHVWR